VICDEAKLDKRGCNGAPDLIVEILSPGNSKYDLDIKFKLYEEAEVLEYWIIEPLERLILVYTLKDGKYIGSKPFLEGENIQSTLFPDLNIAVADVFYRVGKD
jgi:Uma2 family endonuclease